MKEGKGALTNAEGKNGEKDVWGFVSPWCDYSGKLNDKEVGLAIFTSPKNPVPSAWHSRGYGLMAANPFGRGTHAGFPSQKGKTDLVKLAKGETLKLTYAIYLHTGDAKVTSFSLLTQGSYEGPGSYSADLSWTDVTGPQKMLATVYVYDDEMSGEFVHQGSPAISGTWECRFEG